MGTLINGLHHVTTLTSDAQENLDFYAGVLGLRLVKKTVNFDAPDVYHFYYGDEKGSAGTVFTTFPFGRIRKGVKGNGETSAIAFSISSDAISYWKERFGKLGIPYKDIEERFGNKVISFEDPDGLTLELVATDLDIRTGWSGGHIAGEYAIKGFYGVTLQVSAYEKTAELLTEVLDHKKVAEQGNRLRYEAAEGGPGTYVDLLVEPTRHWAVQGGGSVHHIAFSVNNDADQLAVRAKLVKMGYQVTEVKDRQYFHSIYFREPAGILFEVATNNPGFAIDEDLENLGKSLKLPAWQEVNRSRIEASLPDVEIKNYA